MWEFNDPDLGYSFGKPLITKTNAFGKKWLVIVSSGYNNPSGEGKLWFLDAKDGTVLKVDCRPASAAPATPSGLAQFSGYTQDHTNYLAEQIYAGDLLGNFWRFDVSDADSGNWKVEKLATLDLAAGAAQPVTTAPQIEIDIANGVDRWVFVGTGRLLHEDDLADTAGADDVRDPRRHDVDAERRSPRLSRARDLVAVTDADGLASPGRTRAGTTTCRRRRRPADHRRAAGRRCRWSPTSRPTRRPTPALTGLPATLYAREFSRGNSLLQRRAAARSSRSIDLPTAAWASTSSALREGLGMRADRPGTS